MHVPVIGGCRICRSSSYGWTEFYPRCGRKRVLSIFLILDRSFTCPKKWTSSTHVKPDFDHTFLLSSVDADLRPHFNHDNDMQPPCPPQYLFSMCVTWLLSRHSEPLIPETDENRLSAHVTGRPRSTSTTATIAEKSNDAVE